MSRILLLLDQKENQRLLAEELALEHHVVIGESDDHIELDFDLCFIDGASLDRLQHRVEQRKNSVQPVFLPFLLVTARPDVKLITRQVWRTVDELIISPIEKPELHARVQILLRARTLSLALDQRAEAAERAARTRDEVLAMVSHDLRNPLGVVLASASHMLDTAQLHDGARDQLRIIHRAASQMTRLVEDLLEVARIEAGHLPLKAQAEDVLPVLLEACTLAEHDALARGIKVSCENRVELPQMCADRSRILQVLANLIGNALKFSPAGGMIEVSAESAGRFVRIAVTDSGPGISEDDLPYIFDRFWQAGRARQGGAGLGLAIANGIVRAHGGTLTATSTLGVGTTLAFTIPAIPTLPSPGHS